MQPLRAGARNVYRLTKLQTHPRVVVRYDVRLDHDHHILPEHERSRIAVRSAARFDDWRILIRTMQQVVEDREALLMHVLRGVEHLVEICPVAQNAFNPLKVSTATSWSRRQVADGSQPRKYVR